MRLPTDETTPAVPHRLRIAALAIALLASACAFALSSTPASAQNLDADLAEAQDELNQVEAEQGDLEVQIEAQNAEINAALGEVSDRQAEEAAVEAKLAAKQAELKETIADLERQRDHLEVVRKRLHRSLGVLGDRLVQIYMTGDPNMAAVILGSADWSEALTTSQYLSEIQDYDDQIVNRVRDLRDQIEDTVERLEGARETIEKARDAIAAQEAQLADARAAAQARYADLQALQAEREATLAALASRRQDLEGDISSIASQIQERDAAAAAPAPAWPDYSTDPGPAPAPPPCSTAELLTDGTAVPPADAPPAVVAAIEAANAISDLPYIWGGGHASFEDSGYDCSGALSYALNGGGFLDSPLDSTGLSFWGEAGEGTWITVYANAGHAYMVMAGLRFDTSGGNGPRWHPDLRETVGYVARHPSGY